jgi:pimeloyl-ACP methyl ester carboxylesterase
MPHQIAATAKGPIEYRFEGSGPAVLVLNGGHCSRNTRLSHERLSEHGRSVLIPSRPGYDDTPSCVGITASDAADALAALLDALNIPIADVIGISAAGPTALEFAKRHPRRIRKLVLESAVTTAWDEKTKKGGRVLFGRMEKVTWGLTRLALRLVPSIVIRTIMRELTTLEVDQVIARMSPSDLEFVRKMLKASRSGTGFVNDLDHVVGDLSAITVPILAMYSPFDRAVPPRNAQRVARETANCELFEVRADSHLLWIGEFAENVWRKRLTFLQS